MHFHQYDPDKELTFEQLSSIIFNLKMMGGGFIEQEAMSTVQSMIDELPSQEQLDSYSSSEQDLAFIKRKVAEVIEIINIYGTPDKEFETRYRATKNLPPRYEVKASIIYKENKMELDKVKEMVYFSEKMDEQGHACLSEKILKCASKANNGEVFEEDFLDIINELDKRGLEKEAQFWQGLKGGLGNLMQGLKGKGQEAMEKIKQTTSNLQGKAQESFNKLITEYQKGAKPAQLQANQKKLQNDLQELYSQVVEASTAMDEWATYFSNNDLLDQETENIIERGRRTFKGIGTTLKKAIESQISADEQALQALVESLSASEDQTLANPETSQGEQGESQTIY